jgi:hypothetical protein
MTRELDARLFALPSAVLVYRLLALCRVLVELALSDRPGIVTLAELARKRRPLRFIAL